MSYEIVSHLAPKIAQRFTFLKLMALQYTIQYKDQRIGQLMHHYLDYMSQMNSMPLLPVNHNGSLILLQGTAKTHSPRIDYLNWQSWALTRIANIHCIMGSFDIEEEYGLVQTSKWKKTSCKHFMPVVLVPTLALLLLITASRHYLLGQESFNQWNLLSTSVKSVSKLR